MTTIRDTSPKGTRLPRIERKLDALAHGIALLSVGIALSFKGVHAAIEGKRKPKKCPGKRRAGAMTSTSSGAVKRSRL